MQILLQHQNIRALCSACKESLLLFASCDNFLLQVVYRESDSEEESEVEAEDAMAPVIADMNGLESEEESEVDESESESGDSDLGTD